MVLLKVQHSFQGISGIAKDQYVNTFHLTAGGFDDDSLLGLSTAVRAFYTTAGTGLGSVPIVQYLAGIADTPGARVKIYDMSDPIPRQPIYETTYAPITMGGAQQALPSEVACCLSYAAAPVSGVPVARTRGRIYIGPLSTMTMESGTANTVARPSIEFRSALVQAGERLANAVATIDPVQLWVVHSPTANTNHGIVRWWADDAWDTQRRRGDAPTSRVTASL